MTKEQEASATQIALDAVKYATTRVQRLLAMNKFYQERAKQEFNEALKAGRWSHLLMLDGEQVGLLRAEADLRDSLRELQKLAERYNGEA